MKVMLLVVLLFSGNLWASPPEIMFRSTLRNPDDVFNNGFNSPGNNDSVLDHVLGRTCKNGQTLFVPTTISFDFLLSGWALDTLYMEPSSDFVYIYSITPTPNFYNAYDSLMNMFSSTGNSIYQSTALRFQHQQEWIAAGDIPAEQIISAREYRRALPSEGVSRLVFVREIQNPNYISIASAASDSPYIQTGHEDEHHLIAELAGSASPYDVSACFSSCLATASSRALVGFSHNEDNCSDISFSQDIDATLGFLTNPITNFEQHKLTPWKAYNYIDNHAQRFFPEYCVMSTDYETLKIDCSAAVSDVGLTKPNEIFKRFKVNISGGGSQAEWFDSDFESNGFYLVISRHDVPVINTNYTLADYSWGMNDIFSGDYISWWSNIKIKPFYPVID